MSLVHVGWKRAQGLSQEAQAHLRSREAGGGGTLTRSDYGRLCMMHDDA